MTALVRSVFGLKDLDLGEKLEFVMDWCVLWCVVLQQLQKLPSHCNRCVWSHTCSAGSQTMQSGDRKSAKKVQRTHVQSFKDQSFMFSTLLSLSGWNKCKTAHFGGGWRVKREHWCLASGNARQRVHLISAERCLTNKRTTSAHGPSHPSHYNLS